MAQKAHSGDMSRPAGWQPHRPYNDLPRLPPAAELETKTVLKHCVTARAALAELKQAAAHYQFEAIHPFTDGNGRTGIAGRQAASRYLKALAAIGVLREQTFGKEKLFVHPKLMTLLTRESNAFQSCR